MMRPGCKRWQAFGLGTLEFLQPDNRKVLAFIRRYQDECVLVVANLSRFAQPVELNLASFQSLVPVELFGRMKFPAITDKPYFPHAWAACVLLVFTRSPRGENRWSPSGAPVGAAVRPVLTATENWEEILHPENHLQLERALQAWLPSRRWFAGKNQTVKDVHILEVIPVPDGAERTLLTFVQVEYIAAEPEMFYVLPLACAFGDEGGMLFAPTGRAIGDRPPDA